MANRKNNFSEKVLAVVRTIPLGHTLSYQEVAKRAGSPRASRAVGNILRSYDAQTITIPCHRVVRKDGTPGGYRWGKNQKQILLKKEGAKLSKKK